MQLQKQSMRLPNIKQAILTNVQTSARRGMGQLPTLTVPKPEIGVGVIPNAWPLPHPPTIPQVF